MALRKSKLRKIKNLNLQSDSNINFQCISINNKLNNININKSENKMQSFESNSIKTNTIKRISKFSFNERIRNWFSALFIGLIIESLLRERFYDAGIIIIRNIQIRINDNFIAILFFQILSLCASKYFLISIIMILFNYVDTYSSLLLMIITSCAATGTGFFKLIYKNPRPYFHENWVKVFDCETGFGNPSGHSIVAVSVYLTVSKIIRKKFYLQKRIQKYFNYVTVIFILFITFSRLALGAHSLNQILFGIFIGAMIYALFFDVFKIDLNLTDEIYIIMKPKIFNIFSTIILMILFIGIIIFNFFPVLNKLDSQTWGRSINENCPNTPYSKLFEYEAYFMLAGCSSLIGGYLGIYFDIKYNMEGNIEKWVMQNLGDTNWNKTNFCESIIRIFVIALINFPAFSPNLFVSSNDTINAIFFLKNLIPFFAVNFTIYGFTRRILFYFNIGINRKYQKKLIKE